MRCFLHLLHRAGLGVVLLTLAGCIDTFEPEVIASADNYLVVDGTINSAGVTTIRLSRTDNLVSTSPPPAEAKATVFIEEEAGRRYALAETAPGTYTSTSLVLTPAKRYRLFFRTQARRDYASDYAVAKTTPPIDSVTWKDSAQGVQVYVNTHDANDAPRFYRWDYDETWEFTSAFRSFYEHQRITRKNIQKDTLVFRPSGDIYFCWGNERSSAIKLGSTLALRQNIVSDYPLTLMPPSSTKLRYKYSILVKQYALSAEEFAYWELLQKNTENIGTIFDPQPSQLTGNVHSLTDAAEPVIGYVGVHSVTEKRIFIKRNELPRSWVLLTGYEKDCGRPDTLRPAFLELFRTGSIIPLDKVEGGGLLYSTADCADCRKRGTNVRPAFWE